MRPTIAIVGGGAGGLAAAWTLRRAGWDDFVLYEASHRLGGNVVTFRRGDDVIDLGVGYIHRAIYPTLLGCLDELGVSCTPVEVSMAVSRPRALFWETYGRGGWVRDHVAADAERFVASLRDVDPASTRAQRSTIRDWCQELGVSWVFQHVYLLPLLRFVLFDLATPVSEIVGLYERGVLSLDGPLEWLTIDGGAERYVERLVAAIGREALHTARPVRRLDRDRGRWRLSTELGALEADAVILAVPRSQHARLLGSAPSPPPKKKPDTMALVHDQPLFRTRGRLSRPHRYEMRWGTFTHNPLLLADDEPGWRASYTNLPGCPLPERWQRSHPFELDVQDRDWFAHSRHLAARNGRDGLWFAGAGATFHSHEAAFASGVAAAEAVMTQLSGASASMPAAG